MKTLGLSWCAIALAAAALPAGCGRLLPSGSEAGALPMRSSPRTYTDRESWIKPEATGKDLLYFSAAADQFGIYIFSFPKGTLVGAIADYGYPQGLCSNAQGDVFVVDNIKQYVEDYAHGALLPKSIIKYPGGTPTGCAVDATTANLAVMNGEDFASSPNSLYKYVWIYAHAKGKPKRYAFAGISGPLYLCYDDAGNLFIDGLIDSSSQPNQLAIVELPKGKSAFVTIKLDDKTLDLVREPGAIFWDGRNIVVGDTAYPTNFLVRLALSGFNATFAGETKLKGASGIREFWVQSGLVAAAQNNAAAVWKYPAGGSPVQTLSQVNGAYGVAVSVAPP
jgi:hypothetical protein